MRKYLPAYGVYQTDIGRRYIPNAQLASDMPRDDPSTLPFCSVIVPTRDRPGALAACLDSLERLDYPRDRFEVLVADDGSRTPVAPRFEARRDRLDLRILTQPPRNNAAARNCAAREARGELLVFVDDDCVVEARWLRALAERSLAEPGAGIGGHSFNGLRSNPYATAAQLIVDMGYVWSNADKRSVRFLASNNLALPAGRFRTLGGFDESFARSADRDLVDRWRAAGFPLVYEPGAVVAHCQQLDLSGFVRKHFANGHAVWAFHRARRARGGGQIRPEPGYYAALLRRAAHQSPRTAALVFLAVAANYAGYARAALTSSGGAPPPTTAPPRRSPSPSRSETRRREAR